MDIHLVPLILLNEIQPLVATLVAIGLEMGRAPGMKPCLGSAHLVRQFLLLSTPTSSIMTALCVKVPRHLEEQSGMELIKIRFQVLLRLAKLMNMVVQDVEVLCQEPGLLQQHLLVLLKFLLLGILVVVAREWFLQLTLIHVRRADYQFPHHL